MPMPLPNTEWPPRDYTPALDAVRLDDARLNGDLRTLNQHLAQSAPTPQPLGHRTQLNGGLVGAVSRGVLGAPTRGHAGSHLLSHHLPVADVLTTAMADYIAGQPPSVTLHPDDENNERAALALATLTESDQFAADWWQAVYRAGSLGWVFGRVNWNLEVAPSPWVEWVDPDHGLAEFQNGRQVAVLFWNTWDEGKHVWRLLERHTTGITEYALFDGTTTNLGRQVPFTDHPEAAHVAELVGPDGVTVVTGATTPTAHMLGNYRPRQEWRNHPNLRYYATSDVSRAGGIFDVIDANWSQLQHEVDAARGRLFVSEELLRTTRPGGGQSFDWWQDIYEVGAGGDPEAKPTLEQVQFDMRVEQYLTLVDAGIRQATQAMGLSAFTVGLDDQASGDLTATETKARSARTRSTAEAKGRLQRAHLSALCTAFLEMDAALNNYPAPTRPVLVALPERIEVSTSELHNSVSGLASHGLISFEAAVDQLHPEWTDEQRAIEVERLYRMAGTPLADDPFMLPGDVNPDRRVYGGE